MASTAESGERGRASILLESASQGNRMQRQMTGEWFVKGDVLFLRYEEPPEAEMGRTVTTMRIETSRMRIIRHGDVRFEQTFEAGGRHIGYMETPQGRMELETLTDALQVERSSSASEVRIRWSYRLTVMGEAAGEFTLGLTAVPLE